MARSLLCSLFDSNYSLRHVLIDSVDVSDIRQTFYNVNTVYDLFLKFLKGINLFTKI